MADLSNSDFIIFSDVDYLNQSRASRSLPNLQKNPSLGKGEVRAPHPNDELFAHNFLSIADWYLLKKMMERNNNVDTLETITSGISQYAFNNLSFNTLSSFISSFWPSWFGSPMGILPSRHLIDRSSIVTMKISSDNQRVSFGNFFDQLQVLDNPPQSLPVRNQNGRLVADDFSSSMQSFNQVVSCLKEGCFLVSESGGNNYITIEGWNTTEWSYSGYDTAPSQYQPTDSGLYERAQDDGTRSLSQKSWPIYSFQKYPIRNRVCKSMDGSVTKNAADFLDFFIVIMSSAYVRDDYGNVKRSEASFKVESIDNLGRIENTGTTYFFVPDQNKMTTALENLTVDLGISASSYLDSDSTDIKRVTDVSYEVFAYLKTSIL